MRDARAPIVEPGEVPEHWRAVFSDYIEFLDVPRADAILTIMCREGPPPVRLGKHSELVVVDILLDTSANLDPVRPSPTELPPDAHVITAVPGSLPFPDAHFDLISLSASLTRLPDPVAMAKEMARVLAPGGVVGGIIPSRKLDREALNAFRATHEIPERLVETLEQFCVTFPEEPPERWLARVLLEGGLRAIRTRESLDDLLLLYKARR